MPIRILYIDDEPDLREVAALSLSLDPEFDVKCCASGAEALQVVTNWIPDLILIDVMMPVMDGPTTLVHLRRQLIGRNITAAFITARTRAEEIEHFLDMGAAAVISKPFDPMTLAKRTRAILEQAGR